MVDLMSLLSDALIGSFQMFMLNDFGKNMFPYRIKTCWKRILIYGVTALVILSVNHIESTFINIMMIPVSYTIASIVIFQGSVWKKIILACCYYMLAIVPEFLFAVITGAYGVTGTENNFHSELEKLLSLLLMSTITFLLVKCVNQITRKKNYQTIENKLFTVLLTLPAATIIIFMCIYYSQISYTGVNRIMIPIGAALLLMTNICIFAVFDKLIEKSEEVKKMELLYQKSKAENINQKYINNQIEYAIRKEVSRHDALRTIFYKNGRQKILNNVPDYSVIVTKCQNDEEKEIELQKQRKILSHKVYDHEKWPLFTFQMIESPNSRILMVSLDLMVCDGDSMQILFTEIADTLEGKSDAEKIEYSYAEYIQNISNQKNSESYEEDKAYWLNKIDSLSSYPQIPMKMKLADCRDYNIVRKSAIIDSVLWGNFKETARRHKVSPSALLCTLYGRIMAKWGNQSEVLLNLTVFQRQQKNTEKIIGDFTKLLPLNLVFAKEDIWKSAERVQEQIMKELDHLSFDGTEIMRELAKRRGVFGKALLPVVFTCVLFDCPENYFERLGSIKYAVSQTPQVFLDNQITEMGGRLHISWDVVDELFEACIIDEIFLEFVEDIKRISENNKAILEIGAGTGATSDKVLSDIRENKFEEHIVYFYTDISRFFLQRAKERYKECDGKIEMHYQTLDIDEAFSSQLPSNFQADIVIAVGVLNNSVNTDKCIYEINSVMKPGGILLIIETVEDVPDILITQSFMMTEPKDQRKATNTMFLNRKQWLEILEENGFCNSEEFPGYGEYLEVLGQKLFYCTKE